MICKYCGKEIADNSLTCLYCGKNLEEPIAHEESVNSVGKHTLYKAAQAAPERPAVLNPVQKKRVKSKNNKKRRILSGIIVWLLVLAIVVGGGYAIGSIFRNPSSDKDNEITREGTVDPGDIPNIPEIIDEDTEITGDETSEPDVPVSSTVNYPILGAWQWSSQNNGYKDTVWIFDENANVKVYYIGSSLYDYTNWPATYEYDENTGILNIKGGAFHLVWEDENQFAIGVNVAIRIDESVIPANSKLVNGENAPSNDPVPVTDPDPDEEIIPDYIFPESNSRYLSADDCKDLTVDQIRIGRNEIFARHGWLFESDELKDYFESKDWYNGYISPKNFSNSVLNKYERANINFLKDLENRMS